MSKASRDKMKKKPSKAEPNKKQSDMPNPKR